MTKQRRLETLDVDECMRLLATQRLGRLAYLREGQPDVIPLNYLFHEGAVLIRTSWGELLDSVHQQRVAFEVDHADAARRGGWSVVVHGVAEEIWRGDELARARKLPLDPWAPGKRDHYISIAPQTITGRRIVDSA